MRKIFFLWIFIICWACTPQTREGLYTRTWSDNERQFLITNLDSTLNLVLNEVAQIDENEWNWKPDSLTWSVAEVVEHLITHDELFYREATVLSDLPEMPPLMDSLFSDDEAILSYREITPQNIGKAPAYLEPLGRWCRKEDAIKNYKRIRGFLVTFVKNTDKDLRRYYTTSGRGPTRYRDLHQLLLISIAHTTRHNTQIRNIKERFEQQME